MGLDWQLYKARKKNRLFPTLQCILSNFSLPRSGSGIKHSKSWSKLEIEPLWKFLGVGWLRLTGCLPPRYFPPLQIPSDCAHPPSRCGPADARPSRSQTRKEDKSSTVGLPENGGAQSEANTGSLANQRLVLSNIRETVNSVQKP